MERESVARQGPGHQFDRRGVLRIAGSVAAIGTASNGGLLAACQSSQPSILVTPAAVAGRQSTRIPPPKPMYQMDAQHTGRSPFAGPKVAKLLRIFDTKTPEGQTPDPAFPGVDIQSSAAIGADGTIYIGNIPGTLFALRDPGTGDRLQLLWRFHPAPGATSWHITPAIGQDETVYTSFSTGGFSPEAKGTFYALRTPSSGSEPQVAWTVDLGPGRTTSSPALGPDGTLYTITAPGRLFAINPNGTVKWTVQAGPPLISSPALGQDGTVYVASMDGKLYAAAPPASGTEGSIRWTFDFSEHPGRTPLVTAPPPPSGADGIGSGASPTVGPDGTVYCGANNSNFYALGPDGRLKWMFEAEREIGGIWSCAAISADGSTLYFGANKGGLYALDRANGTLRWQYKLFGSVFNAPMLDRTGTLYSGSTAGHLLAINSANGQGVFDFDAHAPVWAAPAIRSDGTLVTADRQGRIMLFAAG